MTSCKFLYGVHIHFSALSGIIEVDNLKMDVPTLKTLVIDTYGVKEQAVMTEQDPDFINWKQGFHVMCTLLNQNSFFHLNKLILDVPFCPDNESFVVSAISNFLYKHLSSLMNFSYHQSFISKRIYPDDPSDDENEHVSLKFLAKNAALLKSVSLECIQIHLIDPQLSGPLWKNFILHQNKLKKLVFTGHSRIPFPAVTIKANEKSIHTIVLDIRDTIDLSTLTGCLALKKLVLMTDSEKNEEADEDENYKMSSIDMPDVKNFKSLPSSLEILNIRYLKVDQQDVQGILNGRLRNLKMLELIKCGHDYNFGVPIQMIGQIWEEKTLPHFIIRKSLNRESLRQKPMSSTVSLLAYVIDSSYSVSNFEIDGTLDDTGNYRLSRHVEDETANVELEIDVFTFPDELNPHGGFVYKGFGKFSGEDDEYDSVTDSTDSSSDCE